MQKGTLPFHYAEENDSTGMTALSDLPAYLDLAGVARLTASVARAPEPRVEEVSHGVAEHV